MRYDLTRMVKQSKARPRKRMIVFRPVTMPATLASDLYAAAYAPVVAAWEQALPAIRAEYERSLAEGLQDSAVDLSRVIASVVETGLVVMLRLRLERWAARIDAAQRRKWTATVKQETGLDISTMVGAGDARASLGVVIERNVELVRSVSDQARARIGEAVFRGLQQRSSAADVAADIREAVDMSKRRARNIAADQTVKAASALNDERRRQAGLMTWEWVHSGKAHPREDHKTRDGKRYSDDPADGAPPPNDRPGELPFCGCTSRAVLSLDGEF